MITITETIYKKMPADIQACFNQLPNPGSDEVKECFPEQKSTGNRKNVQHKNPNSPVVNFGGGIKNDYNDSSNASRFFKQISFLPEEEKQLKSLLYFAKASKSERNKGCEGLDKKFTKTMNDGIGKREHNENEPSAYNQNNHPTVKPVKLMEYLVKLVSRENAVVLDPFIGSGSTAIACKLLNRKYIGLEIDEEYINIANSRINGYTSEIDDEFETDELISDESETNELTSDKKEYYNSLF